MTLLLVDALSAAVWAALMYLVVDAFGAPRTLRDWSRLALIALVLAAAVLAPLGILHALSGAAADVDGALRDLEEVLSGRLL